VVIDKLGEGGMGAVFRAYDPDLDRKVALKILKPSHRALLGDDELLVREAQALAKLNHPNVVAVHEVGRVGDRDATASRASVFIAMEFVEGSDLDAWAGGLPAPGRARYRQALEKLVQAGNGLAAAHDAGLVHRDFKPKNVLVGNDGRVRVADFGLAHVGASDDSSSDDPASTVAGTPAYMAPEQRDGAAASARADQFSFCLTAWEVLFASRPWSSATPWLDERIRPPSDRSSTARHLHRVLARGLSLEPAQRHDDMRALLDALRHDPVRAQRRWLVLGGATVSIAALGIGYAVERQGRCDGIVSPIAAEAPSTTSAAFAATGVPDAHEIFERTWTGIVAYGDAWQALAHQACVAARIDGELGAETYALTQRCLEERSLRLAALLEVFASADPVAVRNSAEAVEALPELESCTDPDRVRAEAPLPEDSMLRDGVLEVRTAIGHAGASWAAGHLDDARAQLEELALHEAISAYGPLRAELDASRGALAAEQNDGETAELTLEGAYWTGLEHRHDAAAARSARSLAWHFTTRNELDEAERWLKAAETLTRRAGAGDREQANVLATKALLAAHRGRFADADTTLGEALALIPDAPLQQARARRNLATVHLKQGRFAEALTELIAVKDALTRALGPDHVELAVVYHNLGGVYADLGRHDEARAAAQRGLEIRERSLGPEHPSVASSYHMLGRIDYLTGELLAAKQNFTRSRELAIATRPPGDPLIGTATMALSAALVDLRELDDALTLQRGLLATRREQLGEQHPDTARTHRQIGWTLSELGRHEEALGELRQAEVGLVAALGPTHGLTLDLRCLIGRTLIALGRIDEARQLFDEAIAHARSGSDVQPELAALLAERGRARTQLGDREGALDDSAEALQLARTLGDMMPDLMLITERRVSILVAVGRHREAATLAEETLASATKTARPGPHAAMSIAYAEALEPTDRVRARAQAEAARQLLEDADMAVPPRLTALLRRLPER